MVKMLPFWVGLIFLCYAKADLQGNCYLDGVNSNQWKTSYTNRPVDDAERTVFKEFSTQNVTSVQVQGIDFGKYFQADMKDGKLSISPTIEFGNYEVNENSVFNPEMNVNLIFDCQDGDTAKLAFYQPINDLNTFEPKFSKQSYKYKLPMPLPADFNLLCLFGEVIVACDNDISNTRVEFSISPSSDFSIAWENVEDHTNKCHRAVVKTKIPLRLTSNRDYQLTVTDAGKPTKSSSVPLHIEIDEQTALPQNPQFKSAYYTATYKAAGELHSVALDGAVELEKRDLNTKITLLDHTDNFELEITPTNINVKVRANLPSEVLEKDVVVLLTIQATRENAIGPGRTVIVVYLPAKICPDVTTQIPCECSTTTENPIITTPCDCSTTTECPVVTPGECTTQYPTVATPCDCGTTTECPVVTTPCECSTTTECPVVTPGECTTQYPIVTTPCDCGTTTECPVVTTPCECNTTPVVTTPTETLPPTTNETTTCPPCVVTPDPTVPTLKFEQNSYPFETNTMYQGILGLVRAVAVPPEDVEYSLLRTSITSHPEGLEIDKSTGVLKVTKKLSAGDYSVSVHALGLTSNIKTEATVTIKVVVVDEPSPTTTNFLEVHHVDENTERSIDLPCSSCNYQILAQYPSTTPSLFEYRDGKLLIRSINLQLSQIKDLLVPQFTISLGLVGVRNSSRLSNSRITYAERPKEFVYVPPVIPHTEDQLIISIIIDDVNDHAPTFEGGNKLIVGYPVKTLATQLALPYLTKVKATDLDVGSNADIRYGTQSDSFSIHPKTGVVYPSESAFDVPGNLKFTVTATDNDGSPGGLSATLEIEVKLLDQDRITVLTIKNLMLEDVPRKIAELSSKSKMRIGYLSAAVVPATTVNFFTLRAASDYQTKIIVYALDDKEEPVKTEDLQEKLAETGALQGLTVDNLGENQGTIDTTGYVAAIAVLATLLVILVIVGGIFYYLKIYVVKESEPYATTEEQDTSSIEEKPTGFVFSPPPFVEEKEDFVDDVNDSWQRKDGGDRFDDTKLVIITDDNEKKENDYKYDNTWEKNGFDENELRNEDKETRKAVSFKPTVEKFNIVNEYDDKRNDNFEFPM